MTVEKSSFLSEVNQYGTVEGMGEAQGICTAAFKPANFPLDLKYGSDS